MSETALEKKLYAEDAATPMGEADHLARKILRDPSTKLVGRNLYRWHGKYYHIVAGRVLTRTQRDILDDEHRQMGHHTQKETRLDELSMGKP